MTAISPNIQTFYEQHPRTILGTGIAMGTVAAATLLDQGVPTYRSLYLEKSARLITTGHNADHVTYTLPGCRTNSDWLADCVEPTFTERGDSAVIEYSERGFCIDSIKNKIIEEHMRNPDRTASFCAISMGGLVLTELMRDPEFHAIFFGKTEAIVYDSSPSCIEDIKTPAMRGLKIAGLVGNSSTALKISNHIVARGAKANIETLEDIEEAEDARSNLSKKQIVLSAIRGQHKLMRTTNLYAGEMAGSAKRVTYIRSDQDLDHVVDTGNAAIGYQFHYGGDIDCVFDTDRPLGSHAVGPRFASNLKQYLRV